MPAVDADRQEVFLRTRLYWTVLLCSALLWTATAQADEAKCLSKRADAAGKYQKCVQKWQSKCYGAGACDQAKLSKCREKYAAVWPKLQAAAGNPCGVGARFVDNGDDTITDNLTGLVAFSASVRAVRGGL